MAQLLEALKETDKYENVPMDHFGRMDPFGMSYLGTNTYLIGLRRPKIKMLICHIHQYMHYLFL
jgi:hypothetical protein